MSSHFPESIDPSYVNSAMRQKCPRKEWRTKSFRLQSKPTGNRRKVCPRTRWRDYIYDFVCSRLGVGPAELSEISVDRGVFWVLLGLPAPASLPKGKAGTKMRIWMNVKAYIEPFYLWTCLLFVCQKWMSYSNEQAYLDGNLRFRENELKVLDIERKMVLTP